jgi:hypothetical protein
MGDLLDPEPVKGRVTYNLSKGDDVLDFRTNVLDCQGFKINNRAGISNAIDFAMIPLLLTY